MMKRVFIPVFAAFLLCGISVPPGAQAAGPPQPMPGYSSGITLNDFLPIGEDGYRGHGERGKHWEDKHERMRERIEQMPPEQRQEALQKLEEMKEKRRRLEEELKNLPPEEREARMEELREEFGETREERREEFREKFREKWDSATPEERAEFCANARRRCDEGGNRACGFVKESCGE